MNQHQNDLVTQLRSMKVQAPPAPWNFAGNLHIGGVTEIGFGAGSDLLLVVTHDGRGLIDCLTCEKIARDRTETSESWYKPTELLAEGIGPLVNKWIPLAGIHGGGLPNMTADYWELSLVSPDWPDSFVIVRAPTTFSNGRRAPETSVKISPQHGNDLICAFGFSPTGKSFVVAMSHSLEVFKRA